MVCVSSRNHEGADRYHEREKDTFLCVFVYARNNRGKRIRERKNGNMIRLKRSCVLELTLRLAHGHLRAKQHRENYASRKYQRWFFKYYISYNLYCIIAKFAPNSRIVSIRFDFIRLSLNENLPNFYREIAKFSRKLYPKWQSAKLIVTLDTNLRRRRETVRCDSVGRRTAIGTRLKESNTS